MFLAIVRVSSGPVNISSVGKYENAIMLTSYLKLGNKYLYQKLSVLT